MTFSGTNVATTINLQANTVTDEMLAAAKVRSDHLPFVNSMPMGPLRSLPTAALGLSFGLLQGAGVFRFQDGSLLIVTVKDGSGCVNLAERFRPSS